MFVNGKKPLLLPGNEGNDCPSNGEHGIECACDECDYALCCLPNAKNDCGTCPVRSCPR